MRIKSFYEKILIKNFINDINKRYNFNENIYCALYNDKKNLIDLAIKYKNQNLINYLIEFNYPLNKIQFKKLITMDQNQIIKLNLLQIKKCLYLTKKLVINDSIILFVFYLKIYKISNNLKLYQVINPIHFIEKKDKFYSLCILYKRYDIYDELYNIQKFLEFKK